MTGGRPSAAVRRDIACGIRSLPDPPDVASVGGQLVDMALAATLSLT